VIAVPTPLARRLDASVTHPHSTMAAFLFRSPVFGAPGATRAQPGSASRSVKPADGGRHHTDGDAETTQTGITGVADRIREARRNAPRARALLVAVTGIDGSGKRFIASRIATTLTTAGLRAEPINIDGWLNLPAARFNDSNPADHFYKHAIRFEELFTQLVLPLRDARSLRLEADFAEETSTEYRRHVYEFTDLDVIVLEGIYLLKRAFVRHYDLSIWIECSFDTALERAVARAQEGLSPEDTIHAYRTIYFPRSGCISGATTRRPRRPSSLAMTRGCSSMTAARHPRSVRKHPAAPLRAHVKTASRHAAGQALARRCHRPAIDLWRVFV
jgi:uridine kinase